MTQSNDSYEIHRYVEIVKNAIDKKLQLFSQTNQENEPQRGPKRREYLQNENRKIVFAQAKRKGHYYFET